MIEQLELLKKLVGMEAREELLTFALESTKEIVKNYCHIKIIPEGLSYTVVRMAADLYQNEMASKKGSIREGVVSSIKMGDTSTEFSFDAYKQEQEFFQKGLLKNYRSQLNQYRKVIRR